MTSWPSAKLVEVSASLAQALATALEVDPGYARSPAGRELLRAASINDELNSCVDVLRRFEIESVEDL